MKKIFLSAFLSIGFLGIATAQNQSFRLMNMEQTNEYGDDTEINEGDVVAFGSADYEEAKLKFLTYNDSSEVIRLQVECEEFTNTNGAGMELCFGECYYGIETFVAYPTLGAMPIQPGQHQPIMNDYFSNTDGNSDIVEYKFRFFELDSDGFEIPNTSLRFTYRYDGNLSVSDVSSSIGIAEVYPTVFKNSTSVDLKENAKVQVLNLEGKTVKTFTLSQGKSNIELAGLASGVYYIQFIGISGTTTTKKVVVK